MSSGVTEATAAQSASAEETATDVFAELLKHDWYIRVKIEFRGGSLSHVKGNAVTEAQEKLGKLYEGLRGILSGQDIQLLPQRLVDNGDDRSEKLFACYWLIGLPSIPSSGLSSSRKLLKEWQDGVPRTQIEGMKLAVQAKFVSRKMVLEQNFKEDTQELPETKASIQPKKEERRTGESFKKKAGSNPAQIRKQFLQHAMGGDQESAYPQKSTGKLRPPKDVLNRLKFDTGYNLDEYVVGYLDRQAGILEKSVAEWQEYEDQELIAYFKHVPEDLIVWDRARKVDWVFNARRT